MMGLGSPRTRTLMLTSCPSSTDWSDKDTWGKKGQRAASTVCTHGHASPPLHPGLSVPCHNRSTRETGGVEPAQVLQGPHIISRASKT